MRTSSATRPDTCRKGSAGIYFSVSSGTVSGNTIRGNQARTMPVGSRCSTDRPASSTTCSKGTAPGTTVVVPRSPTRSTRSPATPSPTMSRGMRAADWNSTMTVHMSRTAPSRQPARRAGLHNWTETRFTIEDGEFPGTRPVIVVARCPSTTVRIGSACGGSSSRATRRWMARPSAPTSSTATR